MQQPHQQPVKAQCHPCAVRQAVVQGRDEVRIQGRRRQAAGRPPRLLDLEASMLLTGVTRLTACTIGIVACPPQVIMLTLGAPTWS